MGKGREFAQLDQTLFERISQTRAFTGARFVELLDAGFCQFEQGWRNVSGSCGLRGAHAQDIGHR